jgi:hypothetical protein
MSAQSNAPIDILLRIHSDQVALLEGLEVWLKLGLISEADVRRIGEQHLVCAVPVPAIVAPAIAPSTPNLPDFPTSVTAESQPAIATPLQPPTQPHSPLTRMLRSFMEEVSVLWLLFLGVFIVIASSAVLAASQWQNVSPLGQYGILFTYTALFWVVAVRISQRAQVQVTAQMLRVTTLLLIPINFWVMDGFRLWRSGLGWVVAAIAAVLLTAMMIHLLRLNHSRSAQSRVNTSRSKLSNNLLLHSAALSWLHWGWSSPGFPVLAVYVGTILTAVELFYESQTEIRDGSQNHNHQTRSQTSPDFDPTNQFLALFQLPLVRLTIACETLLLIARAVLAAQVPFSQLGLAFGICGWILGWLAHRSPAQQLWSKAGWGLLLFGWSVAVGSEPWQAIAISSLAAGLLVNQLQRRPRLWELTLLLLVGLQSWWLLWRLPPDGWRESVIDFAINIAGNQFMPFALVGLGFFPTVGLASVGADILRRKQQPALAKFTEQMALILGVLLLTTGVLNPLIRATTLTMGLLILVSIVWRRQGKSETQLIYLTHIIGLLSVAAWLRFALPQLSLNYWGLLLLVGMLAEWVFSLSPNTIKWRRSAWHLGLGMAGLSYGLAAIAVSLTLENYSYWSLAQLATPIALTGIAFSRHVRSQNPASPELVSRLSTLVLILIQPLTFDSVIPRLAGLGVASLLMIPNTQRSREGITAGISVGFGLTFAATLMWHYFATQFDFVNWLTLSAIAIILLWLLDSFWHRHDRPVERLYAQAATHWGIALMLPTLLVLIGYNLAIYGFMQSASWQWLHPAIGLMLALGYRLWSRPSDWAIYSLAVTIEIIAAAAVGATGKSVDALAIATLGLGLITQLLGDAWLNLPAIRAFSPNLQPRFSWQIIPLGYALLGLWPAHQQFTAYTGLYTLAAALVGVGIGRRTPTKVLLYVSILAVSGAAYELLLYQLQQAEGGSSGDGIALLAGLAIAIAIAQRLLSRWLLPYLRLSATNLRWIAHLHWLLGIGLALLALANPLSNWGDTLWLIVMTSLTLYGVIEGRRTEFWTYAGMVTAGIAIGYTLHRALPQQWLGEWAAAIASGVGLLLFVLPWQAWGWSIRPWQRSARVLPGLLVGLTVWQISIQSLLITAAFYAWLAKTAVQVRLSYLSVFLADWAVLRILVERSQLEPLWLALTFGGSLLYVAQVDPSLRQTSERNKRHLLRCLATGIICFTALYQAEMGIGNLPDLLLGFLTILVGIGFVFAGIALRVRAFLYIGTATFIFSVLRQIWYFIDAYSLLLWAVGIIFGSLLIWVALTFEARRTQVIDFVQYWLGELENWD